MRLVCVYRNFKLELAEVVNGNLVEGEKKDFANYSEIFLNPRGDPPRFITTEEGKVNNKLLVFVIIGALLKYEEDDLPVRSVVADEEWVCYNLENIFYRM